MIDPFVIPWLLLDVVALVPLLWLFRAGIAVRPWALLMAALQLVAVCAVAVSATLDTVKAAPWIWAAMFLVNLALVVAGLRIGLRWLALAGLVGTLAAAALIAIGSSAFVAVAAASAVVALGAALLPRSGRFRQAIHP
jgi:hypothetical protein